LARPRGVILELHPGPVGRAIVAAERALPRRAEYAYVEVVVVGRGARGLVHHPARAEQDLRIGTDRDSIAQKAGLHAALTEDPLHLGLGVADEELDERPCARKVEPISRVTFPRASEPVDVEVGAAAERPPDVVHHRKEQIDVTTVSVGPMATMGAAPPIAQIAHHERRAARMPRREARRGALDEADERRCPEIRLLLGPKENVTFALGRERDAASEVARERGAHRDRLLDGDGGRAAGEQDQGQDQPHAATIAEGPARVDANRTRCRSRLEILEVSEPMPIDDETMDDAKTASVDQGWDLVQQGDFKGAMEIAERSLELDASSPDALNLLGFIHAAEGNVDEALAHYRRAIESDQFFVDAVLNAAELLLQPLQDYKLALEFIDRALELADTTDETAEALVLRIEAMLALGDRRAANKAARALPTGPFESPRTAFLVGKACFDLGQYEAAELHLREAAGREPHNGDAVYFLALTLEARGDRPSATVGFLMTRELDTNATTPPWSLARPTFERRVRSAIERLPKPIREALEGTLVITTDLPGLEVVAEGVDPRVGCLLDDLPPEKKHRREKIHVGRLFVYQRSIERNAPSSAHVTDEILFVLERELVLTFPSLAKFAKHPENRTTPSTRSR
jgi:tetratricopeptide (TPR) repeat protein